jgi:hypothetical protein
MIRKTDGAEPACCGTCTHWRGGNPSAGEPDGRYCPVIRQELPHGDLRWWICSSWQRERHETEAVELWHELCHR